MLKYKINFYYITKVFQGPDITQSGPLYSMLEKTTLHYGYICKWRVLE